MTIKQAIDKAINKAKRYKRKPGYFKRWPSYQKTLTGKPVGRPRKENLHE